MSEDCLFLNISAPAGVRNAPVMVFIHGGALFTGSGMSPRYAGVKLAQRGVIVVSINYRLGIFGYFAHPELSRESPHKASGNYGTLDQIEALKWIKRNITAFGGDPNRVTIFGQSAGALSVTHLLASPLAAGLFQRAIAQSGYLPAMPYLRKAKFGLAPAEEQGALFGQSHGASTLAALRAMPADALLKAAAQVYESNYYGMPLGATAVVDGWVQPVQVFEAFEAGTENKVPFIAGFASGEMRSLDRDILPPFPNSSQEYDSRVRNAYGDLAAAFLRLYPSTSPSDGAYDSLRDAYFGWGMERLARLHSRSVPSTWFYYFDHVSAGAKARNLGAFHSSDVPFVMGNVGPGAFAPRNWPAPPSAETDIAVSEGLMDYWAAFANAGRPSPSDRPEWPSFNTANRSYLLINDGRITPSSDLMPGMYELQNERMRRLRESGSVQWNWLRTGPTAPLPAK